MVQNGGDFDETSYLAANPDVAAAVRRGEIGTGSRHYELFGKDEGRPLVAPPRLAVTGAVPAATNPWNASKPYDHSSTWMAAKFYVDALNFRATGKHGIHWLPNFLDKYVLVDGRDTSSLSVLLLGSNEGFMELTLCERGFTGKIVATDIADKALERARKLCRDKGYTNVEHRVADLNVDIFPEQFDFIIAEGVLHHIENIEFCMANLSKALKPGGLLAAIEYVGPVRFQLPQHQVDWINAALAVVPRRYRPVMDDSASPDAAATEADRKRVYYVHPTEESVIAADPSEAICGPKLPGLFCAHFRLIEEKKLGGGLIQYMTGHFPFAQTVTDPDCLRWLRVMMEIETALSESGIVPSEFNFYVAKGR